VALDPVSKLLIAYVVGDRSLESGQLLIHGVAQVLAVGCVPLFLSDQWAPYATALLTHFGHWVEIPRRYPRGRPPAPRWMPLPELVYAQVVKQRVRGRIGLFRPTEWGQKDLPASFKPCPIYPQC
jgi:hypothetical protein